MPEHLSKVIAELVMKHSLKAFHFEEMLQNVVFWWQFLFFLPITFVTCNFPELRNYFAMSLGKMELYAL